MSTGGKHAGLVLLALTCAGTAGGLPPDGHPGRPPERDPDWHIPLSSPSTTPVTLPEALRLVAARDHYRQLALAGGWPPLPQTGVLLAGQRSPTVAVLRQRLRISGDLLGLPTTADAWFFDGDLQESLKHFQARHQLQATGRADPLTLEALNVPVEDRLAQLEATLTRWHWLPRDLGARYLWANVPEGVLTLVEGGIPTLSMRLIAGHPSRPTPSFQDTVSQIILNPSWSVPRTIGVLDLLPSQQEDPTFFTRLGIRVFGPGGREKDPQTIDWQRVSATRFPYQLSQSPGPLNSLGRFKFVLRNPWDIYLHDTPSRGLFDLRNRTLSSGCLRLQKPAELAALLLETPTPLQMPIYSQTRTRVLPRPIRVYVVYLTTWVTPDLMVHFAPDIYGRDGRLR